MTKKYPACCFVSGKKLSVLSDGGEVPSPELYYYALRANHPYLDEETLKKGARCLHEFDEQVAAGFEVTLIQRRKEMSQILGPAINPYMSES